MYRLIIKKTILIVLLTYISSIYAQSSQIADFAKAAKFDDVAQVKGLITSGIDPNSVDLKGDPMLVIAIRDKSSKVTEYLLNNKLIDVDLSNKLGETPLMLAAIDGDLTLVKRLVLKNKAQIDHIGWTPLLYACAKGRLEVAQFLVSNGADVNALSPNGSTPIMLAAQSGNELLVKYLLDQGADIRIRNSLGLSVIDIAEIYQKPWIAKGLQSRWLKLYKEPYIGPQTNTLNQPS
jgi:ankyrin repeat protein